MLRIGSAVLEKGPAVALTVTDSVQPKEIQRAKKIGGPPLLLELRIDRFHRLNDDDVLKKIRAFKKLGLPLIATIRSRKEGGGRNLSDAHRMRLFRKILPFVNALDLEFSSPALVQSLLPFAHQKKKKVILSYHNFRRTPSEQILAQFIRRGKRMGADLVKLAVTPRKKGDLARLLGFTHRNRDQNLITVAMGPLGTPSRTLGFLFGSLLTYTFLDRSHAPGQLSLQALCKVWGRS